MCCFYLRCSVLVNLRSLKFAMDVSQNGNVRNGESMCSVAEVEEIDFSKFTDRPTRLLNIDRQRSFDERSLSELSFSPRHSSRNADINFLRNVDHVESVYSPSRRSGVNTPMSHHSFEPHPIVGEAWEALRRSLVHFRGQPVGTIAALDNSVEGLNYDQVRKLYKTMKEIESFLGLFILY